MVSGNDKLYTIYFFSGWFTDESSAGQQFGEKFHLEISVPRGGASKEHHLPIIAHGTNAFGDFELEGSIVAIGDDSGASSFLLSLLKSIRS